MVETVDEVSGENPRVGPRLVRGNGNQNLRRQQCDASRSASAVSGGPGGPGRLRHATEAIDIIVDSASGVFDASLTRASGRLVTVFGWDDIEWSYPARLVDLTRQVTTGG